MLGFLASKAAKAALKWTAAKYGRQITDSVLDGHLEKVKAGRETLAEVCRALEIDFNEVVAAVPEQFRPLLLASSKPAQPEEQPPQGTPEDWL